MMLIPHRLRIFGISALAYAVVMCCAIQNQALASELTPRGSASHERVAQVFGNAQHGAGGWNLAAGWAAAKFWPRLWCWGVRRVEAA